jgi:hypothetical protein
VADLCPKSGLVKQAFTGKASTCPAGETGQEPVFDQSFIKCIFSLRTGQPGLPGWFHFSACQAGTILLIIAAGAAGPRRPVSVGPPLIRYNLIFRPFTPCCHAATPPCRYIRREAFRFINAKTFCLYLFSFAKSFWHYQ